jgi:ATP-dependent Clp protease ATP-binding subunit ClpA
MTPPPTLQALIEGVRQDAGTDDPISQLAFAAATAAELEETTDALLGHFVDRCRLDGRSWSEISAALGVSKQAVHKRFAALADQVIAAVPAPTLERFTPRARNVLTAARRAAAAANQTSAGAEHILIGLYAEPGGIGAQALTALGLREETVRAALAAAAPASGAGTAAAPATAAATPAAPTAAVLDDQPSRFTEDGRRALRDTLAVALELGHNYIGTEHMLLALYRNPGSLAARILAEAGTTEASALAQVRELLNPVGRQTP